MFNVCRAGLAVFTLTDPHSLVEEGLSPAGIGGHSCTVTLVRLLKCLVSHYLRFILIHVFQTMEWFVKIKNQSVVLV